MPSRERAQDLEFLLSLDGEAMVINNGRYWVKIVAKRVPASPERPHGLHYSLTLHDEQGRRLLGLDNAHSVRVGAGPGAGKSATHDHRHRLHSVRRYHFQDAETLIEDFWNDVEALLRERGMTI